MALTTVQTHTISDRKPKGPPQGIILDPPRPRYPQTMSFTGLSFSSQPFVKGFIASLDDDTDFRLKLGPYTWRVHSQLISQESDFFRKACDKSADWKESETRLVELHDDEPWMIARMLQYFYYKQYDYDQHGPKGKRQDPSSITLEKLMSVGRRDPNYDEEKAADARYTWPNVDLHMYIVADKYGATNLKTRILSNFGGHGKINSGDLMGICDEMMKAVISRDYDLKRAIAGKVARCYRDTVVQSPKERPMDEWLLSDPQLCLLAMEQMSAPNF